MEYDNLIKIGLLLEVIGFVMASFFIALLKINTTKIIAGKLKSGIIYFSTHFTSTADIKTLGKCIKSIFSKAQTSDKDIPKDKEQVIKTSYNGIVIGNKNRGEKSFISFVFGNKEWALYPIHKMKIWQYPILFVQYLLFGLAVVLFVAFFLVLLIIVFSVVVVLLLVLLPFILIVLFIAHYLFFSPIMWVAKLLQKKDAITNGAIVLGAFVALSGLILQLCSVWGF